MLFDFLINVGNKIILLIAKFLNLIISILPNSPFDFVTDLPYLEYINWVIPINIFVSILGNALLAYGLYLGVSYISRTLKLIK